MLLKMIYSPSHLIFETQLTQNIDEVLGRVIELNQYWRMKKRIWKHKVLFQLLTLLPNKSEISWKTIFIRDIRIKGGKGDNTSLKSHKINYALTEVCQTYLLKFLCQSRNSYNVDQWNCCEFHKTPKHNMYVYWTLKKKIKELISECMFWGSSKIQRSTRARSRQKSNNSSYLRKKMSSS